jgi:micrococcal nuclease
MKSSVIISILAIMLLASLQFIFLSSVQANSQKDDSDDCDSSYPNNCIPSPPPNLNCKDISDKNVEVLPPDPHGFDLDEDGIGCES